MELTFSFLFIALLAITHQSFGQVLDSRFIVRIAHFSQSSANETVIRCAGTLVSQQHILTTASCVIVEPPFEIWILIELATPEDGNNISTVLLPASEVFIHPHYNNQDMTANVAIVTTNIFALNPYLEFVPRSLGELPSSGPCNLFGWGGALLNPPRDLVMVNGPQSCNANFPQHFCSFFDSTNNTTCSAQLGSPLTCGNDSVVAGYVTSDGGCNTNAGQIVLNYHSVNDFREWILDPTSTAITAKISTAIVLFVFFITFFY